MSDDGEARSEELRRQYEEFYGDDPGPVSDVTRAMNDMAEEEPEMYFGPAYSEQAAAMWASSGLLTGTYPGGYLEELREDWDDES